MAIEEDFKGISFEECITERILAMNLRRNLLARLFPTAAAKKLSEGVKVQECDATDVQQEIYSWLPQKPSA